MTSVDPNVTFFLCKPLNFASSSLSSVGWCVDEHHYGDPKDVLCNRTVWSRTDAIPVEITHGRWYVLGASSLGGVYRLLSCFVRSWGPEPSLMRQLHGTSIGP